MRLSADPFKLIKMSPAELHEAVVERRAVIRAHRDAKMDDRCWLDDYVVWDMVEGSPPDITAPPTFREGMRRCREFYHYRRADKADAVPGGSAAADDSDLADLQQPQLANALGALQNAIKAHRDVNIKERPRNLDDDRALYAALPEKVAADFRLPEEQDFLGEGRAPHAGCPSFWRSHEGCTGEHDMHSWGPCHGNKK
ncbi:MAG: hypothetical protein EPN97_15760 [Alphaproteobacteria bacterium]|nr:MAG: hypothetical protein EPN97_15760 [Alphaproteobacteria bacterium]